MIRALELIGGFVIFLPLFFGTVKLVEYTAAKHGGLGWLAYVAGMATSIAALVGYGALVR